MVAELKPTTMTRREVADLVAAYVRNGMTAWAASERVIDDLMKLGLQDALIGALGPGALVDVWKSSSSEGFQRKTKTFRPPPEPIVMPAPPSRRIEIEALKESTSLLEGMQQVGGRWVRLGDMDKSLCRAASQEYKEKALDHAHNARYFHALAKALDGGETIRQRFDDASLMRLWEVAGQGA